MTEDWKRVRYDRVNGDVYEGTPTHTVVPAQPGYSVIEFFSDEDAVYSTDEFTPVLAWIVKVTPTKVGGYVDYRNETPKPVTINTLIDDYAICEPSGKIMYEDAAYNDLAEVLESRKSMRQRLKELEAPDAA
jgi:hypothetical protein